MESFAIRFAWGGPEPLETNHIYNPYGSGWHVDRVSFDRMLAVTAAKLGTILLTETRITSLSQDNVAGWKIEVHQRDQSLCIHAPFLIAATGRTPSNPTWLPCFFNRVDRLIGVLDIYSVDAEPYTLIEAEPCGWWYSAPLPHGRLIVAHMTDADLFTSAGCNPRQYWRRKLPQATLTYARTGSQSALIEPKVVSAASLIRRPVCGMDWLAAGDACVAFDPLSGRGVYNALKGGILAAKTIIAHLDGKRDSFAEYEGWVNNQFSSYLQMRRRIYSKEQRWTKYPFWRRRHIEQNSLK